MCCGAEEASGLLFFLTAGAQEAFLGLLDYFFLEFFARRSLISSLQGPESAESRAWCVSTQQRSEADFQRAARPPVCATMRFTWRRPAACFTCVELSSLEFASA